MLIRAAMLVVLAVVMVAGDASARQERAAPSTVRLKFPQGADLTHLSIRYFVVGPFGGFGSDVRIKPGVREYDLPASHEGQAADTLKAIVYCPGYRTVLITESGFGNGPPRTISIQLEPLAGVRLEGLIKGVSPGERLTIEVIYLAIWGHRFFGILDGPVSTYAVASTALRADGSFTAIVPDFANDPAVSSQAGSARGVFKFIAREPVTGNIPYWLRVSGDAAGERDLPVADAYPERIALTAVPN